LFTCNFEFQYNPKNTIMLNSMVPFIEIEYIMKINQYWIKECMDINSALMIKIHWDMLFLYMKQKIEI